ncbi:hypothetical protein RCH27_08445 [Paracidovorax citrulli]|uniref:hypothetical protein n=1 Tax=Paracidovorax citrulli TaxID=80869 RepID=UPI003A80043A
MTEPTATAPAASAEFAFRTTTDVTLTSVNFRKEIHGDDHVQAVDLGMAVDVPNTMLDTIVPGLREALYCNTDKAHGQTSIEDLPETLPNLRFPRLNGGKFALDDKKNKLAGYECGIEYGLGDERSNMAFDCCKIVKRAIETREGGTVRLSWKVQYSGDRLDKDTCGKLALLEQDLIAIRLIPPVVAPTDPGEDDDGLENPFPVTGDDDDAQRPLTAEELFAGGPATDSDEREQENALSSDAR